MQILEEIASNLFGGDDMFTKDAIKFVIWLCAGIHAVQLKEKYGLELCGQRRGGASDIGVRCYNSWYLIYHFSLAKRMGFGCKVVWTSLTVGVEQWKSYELLG